MPELPEVETVRKVLVKWLKGQEIKNIYNYYPRIAENDLSPLKGETIVDVDRYGKILIMKTNNYVLTSHLRMEGKYYLGCKDTNKYEDDKIPFHIENMEDINKIRKHSHIIFELGNGKLLIYNDVRKFGRLHLYKKNDFKLDIGKEPFDLTGKGLFEFIKKDKRPIKEILLDQSIISGIGNIYDCEILFLSKINPYKIGKDLTLKDCESIIKNSITVLNKAIELGGSTIKSYHSSNGVDGKFQESLLVYGKKGHECPTCKSLITKDIIKGRGTYYCPNCQK